MARGSSQESASEPSLMPRQATEAPLADLPPVLQCQISEAIEGEVLEWWGKLAAADQLDILTAYDARWETCFFWPPHDEDPPPEVFGGRFWYTTTLGGGEWEADWREYMFEHPDAANVSIQGRNSSWHHGRGPHQHLG